MTIHSVLRRTVRNDAIRLDPPEIYNWRVLALAASVRGPFCTNAETKVPICRPALLELSLE